MGATCSHESRLGAARGRRSDFSCVLAWGISKHEQENVAVETLESLHQEIAVSMKRFGAKLLEDNAVNGLILGRPTTRDGAELSAADCAVRMGQLLCRWAAAQTPVLGLRVGICAGSLQQMRLPNSHRRPSFFGSACAGAKDLIQNAPQDLTVNLTEEVKLGLHAFSRLRFTVSPNSSTYILDPATEVNAEGIVPEDEECQRRDEHNDDNPLMLSILSLNSAQRTAAKMPFEEFKGMLQKHNVDLNKFGKIHAKTLEEFYNAVIHQEKSFLTVKDGRLERVVELVRIFLRIRDADFKLRELRIKSEITAIGRERVRNQPLAMVLNMSMQGNWQSAIEKCFENKFGIDVKTQKANFTVDKSEYRYNEEKSASETVPGILSTYKTHSIHIYIKDKNKSDVKNLGLPNAVDFTRGEEKWTWAPVEDGREDDLAELLIHNHIDLSSWSWHAFECLYDELYERTCAKLEDQNGELIRTISIVKVWLIADILNVDHTLVIRSKMQRGVIDNAEAGRPISMRMLADQTVEAAVEGALNKRLGIPVQTQQELLVVDAVSRKTTEEMSHSKSFPGLKTLYVINEVCVRIKDSHDRQWQLIGLPGGTDFNFSRCETLSKTGEQDLVVTHWGWQLSNSHPDRRMTHAMRSATGNLAHDQTAAESAASTKRVRAPEGLEVKRTEELMIGKLMMGTQTDWTRARRAAARIRDPDYSTRDFLDDVNAAFPELRLYCLSHEKSPSDAEDAMGKKHSQRSARTPNDEYQRTIGALFAFFWLMRLHLDGKECFSFGVDVNDEAWPPRTTMPESEEDQAVFKKRQNFYNNTDWNQLQKLVVEAGMLSDGGGDKFDVDRTLAFIVLMVIHDTMKMEVLQPQVGLGVEEFCGYKTGETIMDHDVALSYVLENCPAALPSFSGLSAKQQDSIRFTHSKMEYNMGWLVQAEAPSGALFRSFRKIIVQGKASPADIAFYFAHWFCDLAGAQPTPIEGCEKFVLKFPLKVLSNFIDSFSIVWSLGPNKTETEVFEDYLLWRWSSHVPSLGPPPTGPGSIAQLRLVLMAQGDSQEVLRQFQNLPEDDRRVISKEMAMTGCVDQNFQRDDLRGTKHHGRGPALLIYYSPALMQYAGRKDPRGGLLTLAEIFRQARELWPLSTAIEEVQRSVTVRIDALKDLEIPQIRNPEAGYGFMLHRSSGQDGMVKLLAVSNFRKLDYTTHQVLTFADVQKRTRRNLLTKGIAGNTVSSLRQSCPGFLIRSRTKEEELHSKEPPGKEPPGKEPPGKEPATKEPPSSRAQADDGKDPSRFHPDTVFV